MVKALTCGSYTFNLGLVISNLYNNILRGNNDLNIDIAS